MAPGAQLLEVGPTMQEELMAVSTHSPEVALAILQWVIVLVYWLDTTPRPLGAIVVALFRTPDAGLQTP